MDRASAGRLREVANDQEAEFVSFRESLQAVKNRPRLVTLRMARLSKSANLRHESTFCNTSTVSHLTRPGRTASRELSMAKSKLPSYPETISSGISLPVDGNKTFWMLRSYELPNNKVPPSGPVWLSLTF